MDENHERILSGCGALCTRFWSWCWTNDIANNRGKVQGTLCKDEATCFLKGTEADSDGGGYQISKRYDSFQSTSVSMVSCPNEGRSGDLMETHYDKIKKNREASGWQFGSNNSLKVSTVTTQPSKFLDPHHLGFWNALSIRQSTSEPQLVQSKQSINPEKKESISIQGLADHIRPELYLASSKEENDKLTPSDIQSQGSVHFHLSYNIKSNFLVVRLIQCRNLPKQIQSNVSKTDLNLSNPYIKICILPNQEDSRQTTLRKKTQNPKYDESFFFDIPIEELPRRTLQIVVKDFDKSPNHRIIGQILNPFENINLVNGIYIWKKLEATTNMAQGDLGEILFSLCYLPAAGRLNVNILKVRQLVPTDFSGCAALYVKVTVSYGRQIKVKTTACKKYTLDLVYNEILSFDVNAVQLRECLVVVSVLDFKGLIGKDTFIGKVVLGKESTGLQEISHWKKMMQFHRTPISYWHFLKP